MRSTLALFLTAAAALLVTGGDLAAQTGSDPTATCENAKSEWKAGANYREGDGVISYGGNLYVCKGGAATALCDDAGYEPDRDARATDAWAYVEPCFSFDGPELRTTDVVVSSTAQCKDGKGALTLTATIANDSPFGGTTKVAFYHSASKTRIASVEVDVPGDYAEVIKVSTDWRNPTLGAALITVVADDDGTGRGARLEGNETDNTLSVKLLTCPIPKPGPL